MNCIKRKCAYCGNDIIVESANDNSNAMYDGKYYHKHCFELLCSEKITKKGTTKKKWKIALQNIDNLIDEANNNLSKIFNNRKSNITSIDKYINAANTKTDKIFAESDVDQFIKEQYGIESLGDIYPKYLLKVYNGTYKYALDVKIPPEHLLDMWQAKIKTLNDIRAKNLVLGKEMTAEQRIAYDLAVIVKKYNSYLDWLNKQSVIEAAVPQISQMIPVTVALKKKSILQEQPDNIDNLLQEIFD